MTALSIDLNNISGADGYTIAIVSFTTVFIALAVLIFIFKAIPLILELKVRKKTNVLSAKQNMVPEDKVATAIALSLHLYFNEQHENESNVITICNTQSPWNSNVLSLEFQNIRRNESTGKTENLNL